MDDRFCPFCGTSNEPEYLYCERCGKELPAQRAGPEMTSRSRPSSAPVTSPPTTPPAALRPDPNAGVAQMMSQLGLGGMPGTMGGATPRRTGARTAWALIIAFTAIGLGLLVFIYSGAIATEVGRFVDPSASDPESPTFNPYAGYAQFAVWGAGFGLLAFGGNILRRMLMRSAGMDSLF